MFVGLYYGWAGPGWWWWIDGAGWGTWGLLSFGEHPSKVLVFGKSKYVSKAELKYCFVFSHRHLKLTMLTITSCPRLIASTRSTPQLHGVKGGLLWLSNGCKGLNRSKKNPPYHRASAQTNPPTTNPRSTLSSIRHQSHDCHDGLGNQLLN